MHKSAYPQSHTFEKPFGDSQSKRWRALRLQLGALARAYPEYSRRELVAFLTPKWVSNERDRFLHWLRFYENDDHVKYSASDRFITRVARFALHLGRSKFGEEANCVRNAVLHLCPTSQTTSTSKSITALLRWGAADVSKQGFLGELERLDEFIEDKVDLEGTWTEFKKFCRHPHVKAPSVEAYFRFENFVDYGMEEGDPEGESIWTPKASQVKKGITAKDLILTDIRRKHQEVRQDIVPIDEIQQFVRDGGSSSSKEVETDEADEDPHIKSAKRSIASYTTQNLAEMGPKEEWPAILEEQFYNLVGIHRKDELKDIKGQDLLKLVREAKDKSDREFNLDDPRHFLTMMNLLRSPTIDTVVARDKAKRDIGKIEVEEQHRQEKMFRQ